DRDLTEAVEVRPALLRDPDDERHFGSPILESVLDQVPEDLTRLVRVGEDLRQRLDDDFGAELLEARAEVADDRVDESAEGHGIAGHVAVGRLRELELVLDHPRHSPDLALAALN